MADIKPCPVESAVGDHRVQDMADRTDAAFARRLQALDHDSGSPHSDDQSVATPIKRSSRIFDDFVCRSRSGGKEAGTEPTHQIVRRDVVGGNNDHAPAAAGADPVAGESPGPACRWRMRHWLRCSALARRYTRRTANDPLKAPGIGTADRTCRRSFRSPGSALEYVVRFPRETPLPDPAFAARSRKTAQLFQPFPPGTVFIEIGNDLFERIASGECRGEKNTGIVPISSGSCHRSGSKVPFGRCLIAHDRAEFPHRAAHRFRRRWPAWSPGPEPACDPREIRNRGSNRIPSRGRRA